ncbi:transposase [Mesorhizobium sp. M0684]|uniref:transposase n=1 Tax=Mesorhizobium sp. M0684 TaxID=2956986 RepID=UPI003339A693
MTTKILALTDALGNLVRFVLLPGHRFDTVGVAPLIDGLSFCGLIADKAFDSNTIIADLNDRGAKIVISQHQRRALPLPLDLELVISSRTSSAHSRNSSALPCELTKPTRASTPSSISLPPS